MPSTDISRFKEGAGLLSACDVCVMFAVGLISKAHRLQCNEECAVSNLININHYYSSILLRAIIS